MRLYFGHRKYGFLNARAFRMSKAGLIHLPAENTRTFRFYGITIGKNFFGLVSTEVEE